jgi:hypothetical protein
VLQFSGEKLAEDVGGRNAFPAIGLRDGLALVVAGEAPEDRDDCLQLTIAQLVDHGVRRFLQFLSIHAPIVADSPC